MAPGDAVLALVLDNPVVVGLATLILGLSLPLGLDILDASCPSLSLGRSFQSSLGIAVVAGLIALPQLALALLLTVFAPWAAAAPSVDAALATPLGAGLIALGSLFYLNVVIHYVRAVTAPAPAPAPTQEWAWVSRCRACGSEAVPERDHHCPALNRCVDAANHRDFVLFMVHLSAGVLLALSLSTWGYVTCPFPSSYGASRLAAAESGSSRSARCPDLEGMQVLAWPLAVVTPPILALTASVVALAFTGAPLSGWVRSWRTPAAAVPARTRPPVRRGWRLLLDAPPPPAPIPLTAWTKLILPI